ncbi:MAG: hypothetical protein HS100_22775 [Anaerolineales bacterium]|nr:hypothetical protein [Anaerolineales bacterium]
MKSWIIAWDWTGDYAAIADKVVGVLDSRKSVKHVAEIVEFLYAQFNSNLTELFAYSRSRKKNPYRAEIDFNSRIRCGGNPSLTAEIVENVKIVTDPSTGIETISWITLPVYAPDKEKGLKLIGEPRKDGFTRLITGTISQEEIWDRSLGRFKDKFHSKPE